MRSIVVGAGWAGLVCAYELCKAGHQVTVLEAAPQIGGRARSIQFAHCTVDNGQHICIGAYRNLLHVLQDLGLNKNQLFQSMPLELILHAHKTIHIKLPRITAPLHLLVGMLRTKKLRLFDKLAFMLFCLRMRARNFTLTADCSVTQLLQDYHQPKTLIKFFWEPLTLAIMTTDINSASAQVFLNVLKNSFTADTTDSNWLLPKHDLSKMLPTHIAAYLIANNCEIICNEIVKNLTLDAQKCSAVLTRNGSWNAENVILAIPPWQALSLLQPHAQFADLSKQLRGISFEPIATIYLLFPTAVNLSYPLQGYIQGSITYWVFDRSFCGQGELISVIISGNGPHCDQSLEQLSTAIWQQLRTWLPQLPKPLQTKVIREKRAAFTCSVAQQQMRPHATTALQNLWLCGDYVQNGLPATLEGAIINGKQTAQLILDSGSVG